MIDWLIVRVTERPAVRLRDCDSSVASLFCGCSFAGYFDCIHKGATLNDGW